MAFTPKQIADAVAFYTGTQTRQQQIIRNPSAGLARVQGGGGASQPKGGSKADLSSYVRDNFGWANFVPGAVGGAELVAQALEPMGRDEAPTNAVQWVLNLLGVGTYTTANIGNEIGRDAPGIMKTAQEGGLLGSIQANGQALVSALRGAGMGIAEGFGGRFDRDSDGQNERARTWGQNFEDLGLTDAVKQGVRNLGATDTGEHFFDNTGTYAGLLGFAGDVALDPLTYVGGAGLLKSAGAAARGARAAAAAGERNLLKIAGQAAREGEEAFTGARAAAATARQEAKELRLIRRRGGGAAEPTVDDTISNLIRGAEPPAKNAPPVAPDAADAVAAATAAAKVGREAASPGGVEDTAALLAGLNRQAQEVTRATPNGLDADQILTAARGGTGNVKTSEVLELTSAMRSSADQMQKALKAVKNPELKKALAETKLQMGARGEMALKDVLIGAASRAGDSRSIDFQRYADAAEAALRALAPGAVDGAAVATGVGGAIGRELSGDELSGLLAALQKAPTMAAKKKVVLDQFGLTRTRYQDFDQLMADLAARGPEGVQADPEILREMLKGLGIRSTLTDADALAHQLASEGPMRWEALQAAQRTPREVATDHGVSEQTAAAAAVLDEIDASRTAQRAGELEYQATVRGLGFDPLQVKPPKYNPDGTPRAGAAVGNAIAHGVAVAAKKLAGKEKAEAFDHLLAREVHSAVLSTLKLSRGGTTGMVRGGQILPQYLRSIRAVEEHLRSLGQVPYYRTRQGRGNFYVSLGQVVESLPADVAERWLSGVMHYRLGREVNDPAFKAGLSIYPTTLHAGAARALAGAAGGRSGNDLVDEVMAAMNAEARRTNRLQATELGQQEVRRLAEQLAHPGFLQRVKPLHDAQELQAVNMAEKVAAGLLRPALTRLNGILARDGDRGELIEELSRIHKDIIEHTNIGAEANPSFARELATARLDNGFVNGLMDELDFAYARFDMRAKRGYPTATRTGGTKAATAAKQQTQQTAAENQVKLLDDVDDVIEEAVSDMVARGELEDTLGVAIPTKAELQVSAVVNTALGKVAQPFQSLGRGLSGSYGQGELRGARITAERIANEADHQFESQMWNWIRGTQGQPGLLTRLGDELGLGRAASLTEMSAWTRTAWDALAARVRLNLEHMPPRGALLTALQRPVQKSAKLNILHDAPALPEGQAQLAMEMYEHILRIFNPGGGPFARSGLGPEDVNFYLQRMGMRGWGLDEDLPLNAQANIWTRFEGVQNPLDLLSAYARSMTLAMQRPAIASSVMKEFGVPRSAPEAARLIKEGWRPIDPNSGGRLAKHFTTDSLLHPRVREELGNVQQYLDALDADPGLMRRVYQFSDRIASVLKPSMTILRPGHHGTILVGNAMFTIMRGWNPLNNARTLATLRHLRGSNAFGDRAGVLADDDIRGALTALERDWNADIAATKSGTVEGRMSPKLIDQGVTTGFKDGRAVRYEPEELAFLARRYGVYQNPHGATDVIPEATDQMTLGSLWHRIGQSRFNLAARGTRQVGRWTSQEENFSRLGVMMQVMESRKWTSEAEMMRHVVDEVTRTHPTREALSAVDRRHAVHLVLFYTWMKGAIGSVARTMVERPGLAILPSKFQYNQAEGYGMDPESFGKPIPTDPRIASYYQQGVLGPQWMSGLGPFSGVDDPNLEGEAPRLWGMSLNAPQIDALSTFFGGINFGGDPLQNARRVLGGLNPVYAAPIELASNRPLGFETNKPISDNYGDWLWRQTGLPASVTDLTGLTGRKASYSDEQFEGELQRRAVNFLTGARVTDYTNPTSATIAKSERSKEELEYLRELGYSEDEIRWIRKQWKYYEDNPG